MSNNQDWLSLIEKKSKELPPEINHISIIQSIVDELEQSNNLTDYQKAFLVGIGSFIHKTGFQEFQSSIRADIIIDKIKKDSK